MFKYGDRVVARMGDPTEEFTGGLRIGHVIDVQGDGEFYVVKFESGAMHTLHSSLVGDAEL